MADDGGHGGARNVEPASFSCNESTVDSAKRLDQRVGREANEMGQG